MNESDSVIITVSDTGSGMEEATLAKAFQPFFTTKAKGTGLGLSISREIVRKHNGNISVKSTHESGTTFTLTFPVSD